MVYHRNRAIFYLALAAVGLILLGVSLPGLRFEPGKPIPGSVNMSTQNLPSGTAPDVKAAPMVWVLQSAFALGFIVLLVLLATGLIRKVDIRRMWKIALGLVVLLALLILLPKIIPARTDLPLGDGTTQSPPAAVYSIAPIGDPPANIYWFIVVGLLFCALGIGVWLLRQALHKPVEANGISEAASAALRAIQSGQDLGNAIIACYLQMMEVIKTERGLEREAMMTPREFQDLLARKGVPETPIRQLTRLFEQARYGRVIPSPDDERAAVDCLTAIQSSSCRVGVGQT